MRTNYFDNPFGQQFLITRANPFEQLLPQFGTSTTSEIDKVFDDTSEYLSKYESVKKCADFLLADFHTPLAFLGGYLLLLIM